MKVKFEAVLRESLEDKFVVTFTEKEVLDLLIERIKLRDIDPEGDPILSIDLVERGEVTVRWTEIREERETPCQPEPILEDI